MLHSRIILKYAPTIKRFSVKSYNYTYPLNERYKKQQQEELQRKDLEEKSKQVVRTLGPDERIAYTFSPNSITEESPLQGQVLTKSILLPLPPFLSPDVPKDFLDDLEPYLIEAVRQTVGKEKRVLTRAYKEKPENEPNTPDFHKCLLLNMLLFVFSHIKEFPYLQNCLMSHKPCLKIDWNTYDPYFERNEWIRFHGTPDSTLISTTPENAVPVPVTDREEIKKMSAIPLPDLFPVSPLLDVTESPAKIEFEYGVLPDFTEYNTPHTLIYFDTPDPKIPFKNILQAAQLSLFTMTSSYAIRQFGAKLGEDLANPVTCQAILTSGDKYTYLVYQLNTLNFNLEGELKNFIFRSEVQTQLYEFDFKTEEVAVFDRECYELFVKMLLQTNNVIMNYTKKNKSISSSISSSSSMNSDSSSTSSINNDNNE